MKVRNLEPFRAEGLTWSAWVPAGVTITVEMSADGLQDHFIDIAEVPGPDVVQCIGYNQGTFFRINGIGDDPIEILV